jgi:hypothetical protein
MITKILINHITIIFSLWIITLLILFTIPVSPQQIPKNNSKGIISGILIDAQTKKPIELANFILTSFKDTSIIFGTVSDNDGKFKLQGIPFGLYNGKISLIGYKPRTRKNISFNPRVQEIKLDTVLLMPKGFTYKEIQIIGEKDRIAYDKEDKNKIIVNPDRDWGNNALDLLENTPMVDVDIETGAISMLGKTGTVIYIDGNPAKFSGIMGTEDLKLLSASDIDKFELIINPSIEFGENTGSGVINIITKKIKTTKYNGNIDAKLNTNNLFEGSLDGAYNLKDVSFFSSYINNYFTYNTNTNQSRQMVLGDTTNYLNQLGKSDNKSNNNSLRFQIKLNSDQFNTLSAYTLCRDGYNNIYQNYSNNYADNANSINEGSQNISNTKTLQNFFTESILYNKLFKEKGRNLSIALSYSNNHMNLENDITQNQISSLPSVIGSSATTRNTSGNTNNNFYWLANYNHPVNNFINLFLIYKGAYEKLSMNDDYYYLDSDLQKYNEDIKSKVMQEYNNLNQYVAFDLHGTAYNIQYDFGLGAKNQFISTENKILNNSFQNKFNDFDPNFRLSTEIAEGQNLGISFLRDSQYPMNKQLSPYIDYSDSTNIVAGNPELKPSVINHVGINYNLLKGDLFLNTDFSYNYVENNIETVTAVLSPTVLKTSYQNLSSLKMYNIGVYLRQKLADWFDIEPGISAGTSKYNSPGISTEDKSWSSSIRSKVSFNTFKFQMDFYYSSPSSDAQQKSYANFYSNAAAKLLLFDKQLSLTLRAADLFNTKNNNSSRFGTDFSMINNIKQTTRIISLELSFYFEGKAPDILEDEKNVDEPPDVF